MSDDLLFLTCIFWAVTAVLGGFAFYAWWTWQKRAERAEKLNRLLYRILADRTTSSDDALLVQKQIAAAEREASGFPASVIALLVMVGALGGLTGCAATAPPYVWGPLTASEYETLPATGQAVLTGQAFLRQRNGGIVYGAGSPVTLDPVTTYSTRWWIGCAVQPKCQAGTPADAMDRARRTTTAGGDGRFRFEGIPPGAYYIRAWVSWEVPRFVPGAVLFGVYIPPVSWMEQVGGYVHKQIHVTEEKPLDVVLTW